MWRSQQLLRSFLAAARAAAGTSELPAMRSVRPFASAKAEAEPQYVEVPLPMYGVAGKYASALYVTAVRSNVLDPVETELQEVIGAASQNSVFADFLKDPSVSKTMRMKAVEEIFKDTKFNDVTKNFLAVLAENGRLSQLQRITGCYSELLHAHRGEVQALVTAALELSPAELEDIKSALKGYLKAGQSLKVEQKVDRSIIGGIVVDIQDKHIDLSIDTKIKQMEKLLAEAI
jgi:F-type H+-transporting ATPase subunit O